MVRFPAYVLASQPGLLSCLHGSLGDLAFCQICFEYQLSALSTARAHLKPSNDSPVPRRTCCRSRDFLVAQHQTNTTGIKGLALASCLKRHLTRVP